MKKGIHLLWAMPLALGMAYFAFTFSTFEWCGVSGCSGGGFGRITNPNLVAAIGWLVAGGGIAALPLAVTPWSPKRELRAMVALYYGAIVCLVALVIMAPW